MGIGTTHREYIFVLNTCNVGESTESFVSPFTGTTHALPNDIALESDELSTLRTFFAESGITLDPDGEGYTVHWDKGDHLSFRGDIHRSIPVRHIGVEVVVRQLSDEVLNLILRTARAGNMALTSSVGDCVRIVDREPDITLLARWPDATSLFSVIELRSWLESTIGGRGVRSAD